MRKLFLLCILVIFSLLVKGQDTLHHKKGTFKTTVSSEYLNKTVDGYLSSLTDSTVYISSGAVSFKGYGINSSGSNNITYSNISEIRLRRQGSTGRGILYGALTGAATGAILGFANGDDYKKNPNGWCLLCATAGEKAAIGGIVVGFASGLVGGVIGALAHKTFIIEGKKEKFDDYKWNLIH